MRKLQHEKSREILNTLQEAADTLIMMNDDDAKCALAFNMLVFIKNFEEYIEKIPGTEQVMDGLRHLKNGMLYSGYSQAREWPDLIRAVRDRLETIEIDYTDPKKFQEETDFLRYLLLLQQALEDGYSIIITSMDTPCGSSQFTPALGEKLRSLGLSVNLWDKWRVSYCAVIDEGAKIDEKISDTYSVSIECRLGDSEITVKSAGMQKVDMARQCSVLINGQECAVAHRGLSFVIYDKKERNVVDSVNFDTFSDDLTALRRGILPALKEFMDSLSGVTFINPLYPGFPKENLSLNEKMILEKRIHYSMLYQNPALPSPLHEHIGEASGIVEVLRPPVSYIGVDGARHFENQKGKYLNIVNGHRRTTGQPEKSKRTIYTVGGCTVMGIGVRDQGTLASQLQELLNRYAPEEGFVVENYGFALDNTDYQREILSILKALPLKAGDIVIGTEGKITSYNEELDVRPYRRGELFFDDMHVTEEAHGLVAEGLLKTLRENDFFKSSLLEQQPAGPVPHAQYGFSDAQLLELDHYKQMLSRLYLERMSPENVIGAIVMNCNPFTLGHRYLIEQCAKRCDRLLVFVVQEDKSFFPFEDRLRLVQEGCRDLENVCVLKSGRFILSSLTFSEYFNKASLQDRRVDSSEDVTLFANEIAPAAHIQVRFAGTEPMDTVTRQYNQTLAAILPRYGIRFEEIPRLEKDGEVISASKVRKLLEERKWEDIRRMVPDITFSYLTGKYGFPAG